MTKLNNAHRAALLKTLADARATLRHGEVTSYDPKTYSAKVKIQPEGIETGWLPIMAFGTGNGFGDFYGLLPGAQVLISHVEGDRDNGMVLGCTANDVDIPPTVPGGEKWTVHQSGSFLKFTADGKVALTSHSDLNVTVGGDMNVAVTGKFVASATEFDLTGDMKVTGKLEATKEGTFNGGHTVSAHKHGGVSTGAGQTGTPTG